jgi:hypothetical protein
MPGPTIDGLPDDIQQSLSRCFEELDSVIREQSDEQRQKFVVPPMLYHYTDGVGLFGVIESGTIRLSDIHGLNDPSEIRHGLEIACGLLEHHSKDGHPAAGQFARHFRQTMQGHLEKMGRFFVACFSRSGDDLGQWRAYAANGNGYALGFEGGLLEQAFISRGDERNTTIHVCYDDAALTQVMERLVRAVISILALPAKRNFGEPLIREFVTTIGASLGVVVVHAALLYKHEAYKNEQEYRFLHVRAFTDSIADLKRRARGSRIIHFDEFDWKTRWPQALREIVIGPAADEAAARSFVSECLTGGGLKPDTVRVTRSAIPYRG